MPDRTTRFVLLSQISFVIGCLICLMVDPQGLHSQSGLSFYGNFRATLLPYMIAFGLAAATLFEATHALPDDNSYRVRYVRLGLRVTAVCLLGILVTPSFGPVTVRAVHLLLGVTLFAVQAFVGIKLVSTMHEAWWERVLLGAQLVALAVVVASFRSVSLLQLMIPAQIVAVLSFSSIALHTLSRMARQQIREEVQQIMLAHDAGLTEDEEEYVRISF